MLPLWLTFLTAHAASTAAGVTLSAAPLGRLGPDDLPTATLPCIGGGGYRVDQEFRVGGEGLLCAHSRASLNYGGLEAGWAGQRSGRDVHALIGAGLGWLDAGDKYRGYRTSFLYARPSAGIDLPTRIGTLELDAYLLVPAPLVQRIRGDLDPLRSFVHAGVDLTLRVGAVNEKE
jgi:hypothetical protein